MTITNTSSGQTSIQIRPYAWSQTDGDDQLIATRELVVSPPIASIAPGATQLIRLILRQLPGDREATYRILLDQLPPPSEAGIVHVIFRLSIPIFSQPSVRAAAHVKFHIERESDQLYLVAINSGLCHEAIRNIALFTSSGTKLILESGASPYVLAGATRRWHVAVPNSVSVPDNTLRFTARADSGAIDEQVSATSKP